MSKQNILSRIRNSSGTPIPFPGDDSSWTVFSEPDQVFAETLRSVGGECEFVHSAKNITEQLTTQGKLSSDSKIVSHVDDSSTLQFDQIEAPHEFDGLDVAIVCGELAVAENGAVWISGNFGGKRAFLFLAEHLVVAVNRSAIVSNMHEAYQRLQVNRYPFGAFISGPSKTADIEQSLVIGAQGPRKHTVFVVEQKMTF